MKIHICILFFDLLIAFLFCFFTSKLGKKCKKKCKKRHRTIILILLVLAVIPKQVIASQLVAKIARAAEKASWNAPPSAAKSLSDLFDVDSISDDTMASTIIPASQSATETFNMRCLFEAYYCGNETTLDDLTLAATDTLSRLEDLRETGKLLPFDTSELLVTEPSLEFYNPRSLTECDAQIWGVVSEIDTDRASTEYASLFRTLGITCLNALTLCQEQDEAEAVYQKYAEIGFIAIVNQYLCTGTHSSKVDLMYRLGQIYDHLGYAADEDYEQYSRYFGASVFFKLSFDELEKQGFTKDGVTFWSSCWQMHIELLQRLGLWVKSSDRFFQAALSDLQQIQKLRLSDEDILFIQDKQSILKEWICNGT